MTPSTFIRHGNEGDFVTVEPGISVRDLGIGEASGGDYTLQLVRIEPEGAHVEDLHRHDERFSLAYVLNGWLDVEFAEIGVHRLRKGTVVPAFNGPTHRELDAGDGLELLLLVTQKDTIGHDREKIVLQHADEGERTARPNDQLVVRDFGLEALTGGRMVARALEARAACDDAGDRHSHGVDFQVVYVARGWLDVDFSDLGRVRLEQGSAAVQSSNVIHSALAHSDDLLLIEIVTPAKYSTTMAGAADTVTAGTR
jgi:quercetin dioxygenase-like cupin family protein